MKLARRIAPGEKVRLSEINPAATGGLAKKEGLARTEALGAAMSELHDLLYYAGRNGLLIVLQGRDTAGKDGVIRRLLRHINAQSARVASFKVPTPLELAHDFLWRVHLQAPGRGEIVIFNRSHYEDVLVVRVHDLVPEDVWQARYEHINRFERLLLDAGTIVLKFFLHVSKEEQEERLLAREADPTKAWKLAVGDWKERELWDRYTDAYEAALEHCSTQAAPWHVVPADHKWYRDLAVCEAITDALEAYRRPWTKELEALGRERRREIEAFRTARPAGRDRPKRARRKKAR